MQKARLLAAAGGYDSCGPRACEVKVENGLGGIYNAKAEHKTCRIFKTLMDNSCSFDCRYCGNSTSCKDRKPAVSYQPQELAGLFDYLVKNMRVQGLFLSSAVAGDADRATERMLEALRLVRGKYRFRGYVHFKVLPGTSHELVKQAAELSSRMSINLEAPGKSAMGEMSACKDWGSDILRRQSWIAGLGLPGGQSTQVILNGLATDREVLKTADWEYSEIGLRRVYYSAFRPVKGTPMEGEKAETLCRQNRLYNADFLLRAYGFRLKEIAGIMDNGMLPREDPKLVMAREYFRDGPLDLGAACYEELLRIPGIGPVTAKNIARNGGVKSREELRAMGVCLKRAGPFVKVNGKRQAGLLDYMAR